MSRLTFLVVVISLTLTGLVSASEGRSQDPKEISITLTMEGSLLKDVLAALKKQSGFRFVYAEEVGNISGVKVLARNKSLHQVLKEIGLQKDLRFEQSNNLIAVRRAVAPKKKAVKPGVVIGQIIDEDSGEPLIGATVLVKNSTLGTVADVEGKYRLSLDPGSYDIEFRFVGYQVKVISGVIVSDGQVTSLNVAMKPEASRLGEVVVTAEYSKASVEGLLAKQKSSAAMTDGISSEQMRLTPDNNTAQVLKRVSGVTVQNDRFVTIRGLSDRYNNVLINGASAPSTEPNRRNFSFDIVPSAMVDNVVVNKTASPDLPGEFTGGMVNIVTKDVPDEDFLELSVGTGINTASNKSHMIGFKRDERAYLGMIDKQNKWYGDGKVYDPRQYYQYYVGGDQDKLNEIGAKIPNRWQQYKYPYSPVQNYQLSGGLVKKIGPGSLGLTSAITYRNEQFRESGTFGNVFNGPYSFTSDRYKFNTAIGGLLNMSYKVGKHRITLKNLYNNRYGAQYDDQLGHVWGQSHDANRLSDVILKNVLIQTRLEGEHSLTKSNIRINWNADYTGLTRMQPDSRFIYAIRFENAATSDRDSYLSYDYNQLFMNWGGVFASALLESKKNAGLDLTVPFNVGSSKITVKAGAYYSARTASYNGTAMRILYPDSRGQEYTASMAGRGFYEVATQESFRRGFLYYRPSYVGASSTGDRYDGEQELMAFYGMIDATLFRKLRLTGGYRLEDNWTKVDTKFYSLETGLPSAGVQTYPEKDWLPSVNLIFNATDKFSIRTSYSKTLSRPEFVERSPYTYYDFAEQVNVEGQAALQRSSIQNYDFRLEYFFSPNEIVSASVFYKDFDKPVERFFSIGEHVNKTSYWNLYSAEARGFELNVMKNLSFMAPHAWLKDVNLTGNYTFLRGEIFQDVNGEIKGYSRPVQGLSPYIINGGISYQPDQFGVTLSYNKIGRRIVNGGQDPAIVQYENPRDVIDLQMNFYLLKKKLHARFNISDLLNQPVIIYANAKNDNAWLTEPPGIGYGNLDPKGDAYNADFDYVTYKVIKGVSYTFILTYKF